MVPRVTCATLVLAGLALAGPACTSSVGPTSSASSGSEGNAVAAPDAGSSTAEPQPEAAPFPAVAPSAPAVQNAGGTLLSSPRIVPVFFAGETRADALDDAISKYVASSAWTASTREYGVGAATVAAAVHVTEALPTQMTTPDLGSWIAMHLDGSHPEWGPSDDATIATSVYVLYPPPSTRLLAPQEDASDPMAASLCDSLYDLTGWHWQTTPAPGPAPPIAFAVVGACSSDATVSVLGAMTATTSHELVEATTDPRFLTAPAYASVDDAHAFWMEVTGGGELADLCNLDASDFVTPLDVGYLVQRTWSNAAAAAGHDPCVPAPAVPYFGVDADAPDVFHDPFAEADVHGVAIPEGQSRTIDVHLFSDAPTGDWLVTALDPQAQAGGPPMLAFSLDRATGNNGDVLRLTITPLAGGRGTTALYELDSTSTAGAVSGSGVHRFFGEIVVR